MIVGCCEVYFDWEFDLLFVLGDEGVDCLECWDDVFGWDCIFYFLEVYGFVLDEYVM